MAIFHLHHSAIGRSTHAAGTAGAHVEYIVRRRSCDLVIGEHINVPDIGARGPKARSWMDAQEAGDRKNARVIDKLTLALPHELTADQQVELVRAFATSMTGGKAPYLAAFHRTKGNDTRNQHCHLILRDRHVETGKRVWGNEKIKPTEIMRENWERTCNEALERAELENRIDRRTHAAQGIDTFAGPQKHIGPIAQAIQADCRASWKADAISDEAWERMERKGKALRAANALKAPSEPKRPSSDPVARAETFPTAQTRWKWPQFEALSNIEDPATRKSALTVWVGRIIADWGGLKDRMASFWTATGRKDAANQLESAAVEFPDAVAPLAEKIEDHNASLAAQEAARRQAEAEAERIRKAELARQQSNTSRPR